MPRLPTGFLLLLLAGVASAVTSINVDKAGIADKFWGLGGLSGGGATSRLTIDYKEPQRSQLLDILFKPNFGASLQVLKVEIGGDSQSTDGTESSHMHSPDDLDFKRGYEWWLLQEAKKRNPDIKLYGLPWAFPGWVGNGTGSPFALNGTLTAHYITEWVKGAKSEYDVDIDYIGVWNERSSDAAYVQTLQKTLKAAGFPNVKIVAKDGGADICNDMAKDPAYDAAVDIVGLHYPSDFNDYTTCHSLKKPFWASEESSSYDDINGGACWARVVTSHYVLSKITSSIMWNLIGSYYHGTNWYASSMLTAVEPWSGHYPTSDADLSVVYATAHVTQFTKVGWNYLAVGSGSGQLPGGGYFVTFVDPEGTDFTINVVKIDEAHAPCTRPHLPAFNVSAEKAHFSLHPSMLAHWEVPNADSRATKPRMLKVWYSNFEEGTSSKFEVFKSMPDIMVDAEGGFDLDVPVGAFFTISTITTASKGINYNVPPSSIQFPMPYSDDFEKPGGTGVVGQEAKYFADQIGAYEVHYEQGTTGNKVMRQMVPALPIGWSDHGSNGPMTLIGMREWQDINIKVSYKLPSLLAHACLGSRVDQMWRNGIVLCVDATGAYNLTVGGPTLPPPPGSSSKIHPSQVLMSGLAPAPHAGPGNWHTLSLTTVGTKASGMLDAKPIFTDVAIRGLDTGFAALGMVDWHAVEFDDFSVAPAHGPGGHTWTKPVVSLCPGAAKVGAVLSARNCSSNGLPVADQEWALLSNWQLKHIPSGLCAAATSHSVGAKIVLDKCTDINAEEGSLQQFFNDYTRIRNAMAPMTIGGFGGKGVLVGSKADGGTVSVGTMWGPDAINDTVESAEATDSKENLFGRWKEWVYFPNTNQLRNQYVANEALGYPMCLSTCPPATIL